MRGNTPGKGRAIGQIKKEYANAEEEERRGTVVEEEPEDEIAEAEEPEDEIGR